MTTQTAFSEPSGALDGYAVLSGLINCADGWEPDVRLLGNIRAGDIVRAVSEVLPVADDGEPVTADWLFENGWQTICNGTRASIDWIRDHPIQLWRQDANRWSVTMGFVEFNVISTRGDVRRLMKSLGLEA